ncbi:GNAT family N-acetyltransferase [Roseateles sp.]|jgi:putative acetyltransferase|uniref:GNAT family N-acetyltransferase n=1 Tax=Roseateles sp. TaxID=1971397 RepID=UPI0037C6CB6E
MPKPSIEATANGEQQFGPLPTVVPPLAAPHVQLRTENDIPMHVYLESPRQAEVIELIAELDAFQDALYPPEARYALDLVSLEQENVLFAVARDSAGVAMGCGAVVLQSGTGEVKRMFVRPSCRAHGAAAAILATLESEALSRGCRLLQLETGPYQHAALAFYKKHGFEVRCAFGSYPEHPLSVFRQKSLGGERCAV